MVNALRLMLLIAAFRRAALFAGIAHSCIPAIEERFHWRAKSAVFGSGGGGGAGTV